MIMRKKAIIIILVMSGIALLPLFCIKVGKSYGISYDVINMSHVDKKTFMQSFKEQVAAQGYKQIDYNPKWSMVFLDPKQKFYCYVNENDRNGKSIFFWLEHEDCTFRIMFKYYVEGNPYFLSGRIYYFRNFGHKLTETLPELKIYSDDYLNNCETSAKNIKDGKPELRPPVHADLEVYLNKYKMSPTIGAIGHPNLTLWQPNERAMYTFGVGEAGKPQYSARIEYKGTKDGNDYYSFTITYPVENNITSFTEEIIYKGDDIEIWRDSEYRIGIRPRTNKK